MSRSPGFGTALAVMVVLAASGATALGQTRLEGWGGVGFGSASRVAAVAGVVGTATAAIPIGEGGLRFGVLALRARLGGGEFTPDSGTTAAVTLSSFDVVLGARYGWLSLEGGMGQRSLQGALSTRQWMYTVAGARAEVPFGRSGLTAGAAAHVWIGGKESGATATSSGLSAESYLLVRPWTAPVFTRLSYRADAYSDDGATPFPDRSGTLGVSVGVTFGGAIPGRGPGRVTR